MENARDYVQRYDASLRGAIVFAWNGKHAHEFEDRNQEFRWEVVRYCMASPNEASPELVAELFLADAEWSAEAWGSPQHFAQLGALLLERGGAAFLIPFARGFSRSFDTYGACHAMALQPETLSRLKAASQMVLSTVGDQQEKQQLQSTFELFSKLEAGTAGQGWVTIAPGTNLKDMRVVWPRWYHKVWDRLRRLAGLAT